MSISIFKGSRMPGGFVRGRTVSDWRIPRSSEPAWLLKAVLRDEFVFKAKQHGWRRTEEQNHWTVLSPTGANQMLQAFTFEEVADLRDRLSVEVGRPAANAIIDCGR